MAPRRSVLNGLTGTRTLRWLVAGSAALLLAVVLGFIVAGRLKMENFVHGLPRQLGVDIEQETNSFTYSQSYKGRKIFMVHAAKEVQRKDGRISLHQVAIVLYGPTGAETDHIQGDDFEYDQKAQVLSAKGEVFIDLTPPNGPADSAEASKDQPGARLIHVKTVGLIFDQKAALATTDGAVEFRSVGYSGNAVGASYRTQDGVVVLKSAVHMSGLRGEPGGAQKPVDLRASRAELDRRTNTIDLVQARYVSGGDADSETLTADHAIVHTSVDGTPQRIDAAGDVTLDSDARGKLTAQQMQVELGPSGQARAAHFAGDVRFAGSSSDTQNNGRADQAQIAFDEGGRPTHALMQGNTSFTHQAPVSMRRIEAATLDMSLGGGGKEPVVIQAAQAYGRGGAKLSFFDEGNKGQKSSEIKADKLSGRFQPGTKETELTGLDGVGHTSVERIAKDPAGVRTSKDTSVGDLLHVQFKPADKGKSDLTRAEQAGSVVAVHEGLIASGAKKGQVAIEHLKANRSVYEADADMVHMTGGVQLQDEASVLFADAVDLNHATGESVASGSVKVSYASDPVAGKPPEEPVHVLAARAVGHQSSRSAQFFAGANGSVRMWQGTSQVEAPEIDVYKDEKRLVAFGSATGPAAVRTVLTSAKPSNPRDGTPKERQESSSPVRVLSRSLVYTDAARTAEFTGGVRTSNGEGTMMSRQVTVFLTAARSNQPAGQITGQPGEALLSGNVDRIVATGNVALDQPGRRATGEKLVYTGSDGVYLLTGTPAAPPRVVDQAEGTTTGAALKFLGGEKNDRTIVVLGTLDDKKPGRVRTETRMSHE